MKKYEHRYQKGDCVKVRGVEEIEQQLDPLGRQDGCMFMPQMWECCEKEFKIAKQVKHLFDEKKMKIYKTNKPIYILEGVICEGKINGFDYICDHSCHILWHENWLQSQR